MHLLYHNTLVRDDKIWKESKVGGEGERGVEVCGQVASAPKQSKMRVHTLAMWATGEQYTARKKKGRAPRQ